MPHFHFGIKKDEKRGVFPVQAYTIAGITFHSRTASYDHQEKDYRHKVGQFLEFSDKKHEEIKAALRVDRAPENLNRDMDPKTGKPVDERALKYRVIHRGEGVGTTFKATELRDVLGFGKVVQWTPMKDDQGRNIAGPGGWSSKIHDLSDPDYVPMADPANEEPLAKHIFCEKKDATAFNPPAIDLGPADDEAQATKIEAQEQSRDPKGFEATQDRIKKAKASGLKLEG